MKQSNKKSHSTLFKYIGIIVEVCVLIGLVMLSFYGWRQYRPEKSKNIPIIFNTSFHNKISTECDLNSSYFLSLKEKDNPDPPTFEEKVVEYVFSICKDYPSVDPYVILGIIFEESRFSPYVSNGNCVGLMQVSTYWHRDRAARLGVNDFLDPYGNILIGIDLVNELLTKTDGDIYYALMQYNQTYSSAKEMYSKGIVSQYAKDVIAKANDYREVYFL